MAEKPCPTKDPRVQLFGLLLETNARLARQWGLALEAGCGMSLATFETLLHLRRSEGGRLKMNEVAEATVHSTGGTTRLIDRLEEAGLVERQSCPTDRRATYVAITEAGNQALDDAFEVHCATLDETWTSRLSERERTTPSTLLTQLSEPA